MSLPTQTSKQIIELVRAIADAENQSEVVRQVLCEKSVFEPYTAFQRVSQLSTHITTQNLANFLEENNFNVSQQEVFHLVRLYDSDADGKLSYNEFLMAVLTRKDAELRKEVNKRKPYALKEDEGLPYQVEHAIARIFEEELETRKTCEGLRQKLALAEDFNILNVFRVFDAEDNGYVDTEMIKNFAQNVNEPLTESQISAFFIRVDKDADGLLRYSDFLDIFSPSELGEDIPSPKRSAGSPTRSPKRFVKQRTVQREENIQSPSVTNNNNNTYASPKKVHGSPTRAVHDFENVYSPVSTKADSSLFFTPTRKSPSKLMENSRMDQSQFAQSPKICAIVPQEINFSPRKDSPMKPKEEFELVRALKEMVDHIRALENVKNSLALLKDFNTYNAFAVFDADKRGAVNVRQLEEGLKLLNVHADKSDITLLMKRLDSDLDGIIKYGDFSQAVLPRTGEFAKLMGSRDPYYMSELEKPEEAFTEETLAAFKTFLTNLIDGEALSESIRQRLVKRKRFNLHDAFKALDREEKGFITAEEFKDMLAENGVFYSQKDVNTLVERYTKATKGKVSYYDFVREMTPKSVANY